MDLYNLILCLVVQVEAFWLVEGSRGDTYISYQSCVESCISNICKTGRNGYSFADKLTRMLWSCPDNCNYECMWPTIDMCTRNQIDIPQFRGKWPFVRWLGMQEPASALFSICNLLYGFYVFKKFWKKVRFQNDIQILWFLHSLAFANAWICSTLFHIRDVELTETLDYIGAFTLVLFTLCVFGYRILYFVNWWLKSLFATACLTCYCSHTIYLLNNRYNYQYNIWLVMGLGATTSIIVLIWSLVNYKKIPHVKYAAIYVGYTSIVALLEIIDIPPVFWIFDSHSLWHLATIPLPSFLYKFVTADCLYLRQTYQLKIN